MRRLAPLLLAALGACQEPSETPALARTGVVSGDLEASRAGDAWVFLYGPGEGPPGQPAVPRYVTAAGAGRLAEGRGYIFGEVEPGAYRLLGLLDVDRDFDATVDVLAQPSAGDRWSDAVEVQAQPGRGARVDLGFPHLVTAEPPAFSLEGVAGPVLSLDTRLDALVPLTLVADPVGRFEPDTVGFTLGLVDADGDARPDDADGDGSPDLSLQLVLRWRPRPGQLEDGMSVVVPLLFDPSPFLRTLEGRLGVTVVARRLQAVMAPQALLLEAADGGLSSTRAFGAPPPGDYEVVALAGGGQAWKLPNDLGPDVPSQAVRVVISRSEP